MRTTVLFLFVLAVSAAAAQTKSPQKPGKWQVTMEMEMPGMPMKLPAVTMEHCVTEQDLADPQKAVPADPKSDCTVGDYKVKDNTVNWSIECPKQKMKGSGEITYTNDTFAGTMKMKMDQQEMSTKYSGKWLGACTK
jgi:hypothetical protein